MAGRVEDAATGWRASGARLISTQAALLNGHVGPLRRYQWLWLLFCIVGALAVAAPRALTQPLVYFADAEARFDMRRYGGIYHPVTSELSGLDIAMADASEALRQNALAARELRYGLPSYRVDFQPIEPGLIRVRGIAPSAAEAKALADDGAEELARQIRAAGGREILRNMLGWELWLMTEPQGVAVPTRFDELLRQIIRLRAFPMSREPEPVSEPRSIEMLSVEEHSDLGRALESRYDLWRFAVNTRNTTLDALCGTAGETTTPARELALDACTAMNEQARNERIERDREIERLRAIEATLSYLLREQGAVFVVDEPSAAHRVAAALPITPQPRFIPQILLAAVLAGAAFGALGVAVDRSINLTGKIGELWQYRSLILNLVMRDLRTRYKGSALGYLWTQLAPLLTMLVFVAVFGLIMRSNIALYPVFVIVALLPWNFAAEAIIGGTRSVIDSANLVKKVYFPREVLPLVSVFSSLLNYLLSLPMMFLVMVAVQYFTLGRLNISATVSYLPVLLIIQTVFLAGVTLLLSALAVFFRDIVHLIGIVINFWFFLTPVFYSLDLFGNEDIARLIRWLNPMASLVEFYREILYGNTVTAGLIPTPGYPALSSVLRVAVTALAVLAVGYWYFQRNAGKFGEEL
jgi:lipopolysaccharide transport system permease protein